MVFVSLVQEANVFFGIIREERLYYLQILLRYANNKIYSTSILQSTWAYMFS